MPANVLRRLRIVSSTSSLISSIVDCDSRLVSGGFEGSPLFVSLGSNASVANGLVDSIDGWAFGGGGTAGGCVDGAADDPRSIDPRELRRLGIGGGTEGGATGAAATGGFWCKEVTELRWPCRCLDLASELSRNSVLYLVFQLVRVSVRWDASSWLLFSLKKSILRIQKSCSNCFTYMRVFLQMRFMRWNMSSAIFFRSSSWVSPRSGMFEPQT